MSSVRIMQSGWMLFLLIGIVFSGWEKMRALAESQCECQSG